MNFVSNRVPLFQTYSILNFFPSPYLFVPTSTTTLGRGGNGGSLIHFRKPFTRRLHFGSDHDHTVFESEIIGATLALSSIPSLPQVKRIFLGIDSQSAIRVLLHPREQPGQYLLLEFHRELTRLLDRIPGVLLHIGWVPGHVDFEPNERVDEEAKHAAQNDEPPHPRIPALFHSPLPRGAAAAKAEFKTHAAALWASTWETSPRHEKFAHLDKDATVHSIHKLLINLSSRNSSLIVQLRTRMTTSARSSLAPPLQAYELSSAIPAFEHRLRTRPAPCPHVPLLAPSHALPAFARRPCPKQP
ncbi:hypothetical protein DFH09DRAFT_1332560 [Mycena vulgaris]|nr:hypothetical protein DFH09DRAFT_1332560 [Mycena vulgaris]